MAAILRGSVSPATSTITGAFMLRVEKHDNNAMRVIAYLICSARVPKTRAFSYLVMYRVVVRSVTRSAFCASSSSSSNTSTSWRISRERSYKRQHYLVAATNFLFVSYVLIAHHHRLVVVHWPQLLVGFLQQESL